MMAQQVTFVLQRETVTDSKEAPKAPKSPKSPKSPKNPKSPNNPRLKSPDFDFPSLPPSPPPEKDYPQSPVKSGTLARKKHQASDKTMECCDKVDQVNEVKRTQFSALENDLWENRKADRRTISSVGRKHSHSPDRKSKSSLKHSPNLNRDQRPASREAREASVRGERDRQVAQELVSRVSAPDPRQTWRPELDDEAWIPQPPSGSTEPSRARRESRSRRRAESEVGDGL